MRAKHFLVRCYAFRDGGLWVAGTLELGLAVQADSFDQARTKLDEQIRSYVGDALGPDREHADELLSRRAPLSAYLRYYWIRARIEAHMVRQNMARIFSVPALPAPA